LLPGLLLTIILIAVFWALMIRPQQQRQREHLAEVDSLVAGDRVESFSGIHGTLVEVGDQTVRMEIAEGVVVTMARLAVSKKLDEGGPDDEQEDQS
jgi:preprotein translocase subunit YajC